MHHHYAHTPQTVESTHPLTRPNLFISPTPLPVSPSCSCQFLKQPTALMLASANGDMNSVKLLLEYGADITAESLPCRRRLHEEVGALDVRGGRMQQPWGCVATEKALYRAVRLSRGRGLGQGRESG